MTLPSEPLRLEDVDGTMTKPAPRRSPAQDDPGARAEVMAYYFPQWHRDPRNDDMLGDGWTEWDLLREATPRYPGHRQPKRPLWGETDESEPENASRAVSAALDHGLTGFLVDWYWYDNQPFLNGFLDRGLLNAERLESFRFALMWANHDWTELYPAQHANSTVLLPAPNTRYHAEKAFDHILAHYLGHPSYWTVDGAPYFSIYDLPGLIRGMGGVAETASLLDKFRHRAQDAGLLGLHLNGVLNPSVPNPASLLTRLGFDSATHYTWWHHPDARYTFPTTEYQVAAEHAAVTWQRMADELPVPYFPNVTVGWDPSPRTTPWPMDRDAGYPFTSILEGNTPESYGQALSSALELANKLPQPRAVTINAWNEWTEGSYLEPDTDHGYAYLKATANAIAPTATVADPTPSAHTSARR